MNSVKNIIQNKDKNRVNITMSDLMIAILFLITVIGLYFSDSIISYAADTDEQLTESRRVSRSIAALTLEIDKINLDVSILNNQFLRSVTSFPTYQLDTNSLNFGKPNPFTGNNVVVASTTNVLGGVRYSSQTSTSTGIITTTPTATTTRR